MKVSEANHPTNLHEACVATPLGRAIHLLGDSWVLLIVMNLLQGSMRFNALRATLGHISSKTLSSRLKLLEELDFVQRLAFLEIPSSAISISPIRPSQQSATSAYLSMRKAPLSEDVE